MTVEPITKPPRKPSNDAAPRIYSAIASVMAEIGKEGISKDRKNEQQGYKFRGIDDVYNALAPMLAKHDLIVIPRVLSRDLVERKNQKGNALFYVTCQVEFTLVCSLDGSSIQAVTYGEAMDSADKATNKAMSAAYKYMAMQTFCIPTEGDNDADSTTHEVAPSAAGGSPPPASSNPLTPHARKACGNASWKSCAALKTSTLWSNGGQALPRRRPSTRCLEHGRSKPPKSTRKSRKRCLARGGRDGSLLSTRARRSRRSRRLK